LLQPAEEPAGHRAAPGGQCRKNRLTQLHGDEPGLNDCERRHLRNRAMRELGAVGLGVDRIEARGVLSAHAAILRGS